MLPLVMTRGAVMKKQNWQKRLAAPAIVMLRARDMAVLLFVAIVCALMLLLLIAACAEDVFNMAGEVLLCDYGVLICVIATVLGLYCLRSPLRRIGLIEQL